MQSLHPRWRGRQLIMYNQTFGECHEDRVQVPEMNCPQGGQGRHLRRQANRTRGEQRRFWGDREVLVPGKGNRMCKTSVSSEHTCVLSESHLCKEMLRAPDRSHAAMQISHKPLRTAFPNRGTTKDGSQLLGLSSWVDSGCNCWGETLRAGRRAKAPGNASCL